MVERVEARDGLPGGEGGGEIGEGLELVIGGGFGRSGCSFIRASASCGSGGDIGVLARIELWSCPEAEGGLMEAGWWQKDAEKAEVRAAGETVSERFGVLTMRAEAKAEAVVMFLLPGDVRRGWSCG